MAEVIKLSSPATQEYWEIPVLYEDDHLLALDKPSGLLASPDRNAREQPNLMSLLHAGIAESKPWARQRGLAYLMNAHRLDFETSGVMLLAKTKAVLIQLADLFGSEKPCKTYLALVQGTPANHRFEVDAKLASNSFNPGLMKIDPKHGKRSQTIFEVVETFSDWTLLKCQPLTERTHQIRVHLRYARFPIVGDEIYGGGPLFLSKLKRDYRQNLKHQEKPLIDRAALHAQTLTLNHPVTGAPLLINAALPKDLAVALKYLRRFAVAPVTAGD
jgi:RluA family pseudouridine synthase